MSRVDDLISDYERFVRLPWPNNPSTEQRVWMALYTPDQERRLRLRLQDFEIASKASGYEWDLIDISNKFETWMAAHEYRDAYFAKPQLMQPELVGFFEELVENVRSQIIEKTTDRTIIGLLGTSNLYGLGDHVKVSALIDRVQDSIDGRLLVLFPGEAQGNVYRLLGARDGWNYLAINVSEMKGARQ